MNRIEFQFRVPADHPSLPGHFPGNPIVPGVLLLDHVLHALRGLTGLDMSHLRQVKFSSALLPQEQAHAWWQIDGSRASFGVCAQRGGVMVAVAEGSGNLSSPLQDRPPA